MRSESLNVLKELFFLIEILIKNLDDIINEIIFLIYHNYDDFEKVTKLLAVYQMLTHH